MTGEILDLIKNTLTTAIPDAGLTRNGTLFKVTRGSRTSGDLAGGTNPTKTPFSFQGFYDDRQLSKITGLTENGRSGSTLVQRGDRVVVFMLGTISGGVMPEPNDKVLLEGVTTTIDRILETDPAGATATALVRAT